MRSLTRLERGGVAFYFHMRCLPPTTLGQDSAHLTRAEGVGVSWRAVEAALATDPHRLPPALLADVQRHL